MAKRLIVGLGNPGPRYARTRHNIGFEVVDAVAERVRQPLLPGRAPALVAEGRWRGRPFVMAQPQTYMNRSGEALRALTREHRLTMADVLVVVDDINLPPGTVRLRERGSAGGHNGLQDIIDHMGTDAFARLRIGVGNDFSRGHQADYVLDPFTADERPVMDEAVVLGRDAALTFVVDGLVKAMNRYNKKK